MFRQKISKLIIGATVSVMFMIPGFASADNDPTAQISIIQNQTNKGDINATSIYKDMNSIVELVFYGAGFFSLISLIIASVLLATSGHNPQRRSAGFAALGMSLLGGWILYKSTSIATWLGHFGS